MKRNSQAICTGAPLRVINRLTIHGEPLSFRELCKRTIPEDTDYLVLDVDHTTHLHRNLGELLGWEICAERAYGKETLDQINLHREPGRFLLLKNKPLDCLRYLTRAAHDWALPGLFYLVWAKWLTKLKSTRPLAYLRFGVEPRQGIQAVPQHKLLEQLCELPLSTLRHMADRVWERHHDDQVVTREDLTWLRERCPGLTIILSSASPQPVLEAAARHLDVDHIFYTRVEEHQGFLSHPASAYGRSSGKIPRRISPLEKQQVNSRETKVKELEKRFPDIFKPWTRSVGVTDTGYGEDHCWANHFDIVMDINSTDPFPPIVETSSPCQHIHSAEVLSRKEHAAVCMGLRSYRDKRRPLDASPGAQEFCARDLENIIGQQLAKLNRLRATFKKREFTLNQQISPVTQNLRQAQVQLNRIVNEFNCTVGPEKKRLFSTFRQNVRAAQRISSRITKHLRPLALLNCQISNVLEETRLALSQAESNL